MHLISLDEFRKVERKKREHPEAAAFLPSPAIFRVSIGQPKAADESRRAYRFCFSDSSEDRMTDTIDAKGWRLNNFMRAPTALFAHDSSSPPIGKAANVMIEDTRLMGDIEFAPPQIYEFADTIYKLVGGGFLNAVSVGFQPIDYDWAEDDDDRPWGMDFKTQELLEISVVPVPANPRALIEARAKGIDTRPIYEWAERTLDGGGKVIISRTELERLRKAAKEPAVTKRKYTVAEAARGLKADGMSEGDPANGGAFLGNCGRPIGEECGMKDPAECSIHGQGGVGVGNDTDEDKRLAEMIRREIAKYVEPPIKASGGGGGVGGSFTVPRTIGTVRLRLKSDSDGDDDGDKGGERPDMTDDHEKCFRAAHMHMKAMSSALDIAGDHFDNAMSNMDTIKEALDAEPPKDDGEGPDKDPEAEKAARLRKAQERRQRISAL